jgi:hypothetical protein
MEWQTVATHGRAKRRTTAVGGGQVCGPARQQVDHGGYRMSTRIDSSHGFFGRAVSAFVQAPAELHCYCRCHDAWARLAA